MIILRLPRWYFWDPFGTQNPENQKTQKVDKTCSTPTFLAHNRSFRPPPPAPFPAPSWPRPDLDPESSARATEIPLQKRLYIKAICKILENFTFPEIPGAIFSEIHFGRRQVEILTNRALHQRFLLGLRARRRRGFPKGPPRRFQEKSQKASKVFINDRFYSAAAQKKSILVLNSFKINLGRPGKRFV